MALEKDFELLDDYLANRLNAEDRASFETKLQQDTALREEYQMQQAIADGIRTARTAELKTMLSKIPVTSIPASPTTALLKVGTWVAITGLVATATYFYFAQETAIVHPLAETEQEEVAPEPVQEETPAPIETPAERTVDTKAGTRKKPLAKSAPATKPSFDVYDPSKEGTEEATLKYEGEQLNIISKAFVTSSIEVEIEHTDKKYSFHYMFRDDKLILFGGFEKHLYEILEFISADKKTVVLFYKTNYYLLDINKSSPTPLTSIKNKALLKKLKEYRSN
jgi:hypothetical protein